MFKSLDSQTGKEIIILHRSWNKNTIAILRSRSQEQSLICPECQQPVLVKAGHIKRWHFAHRDLGHCPLKNESANILHARSLLYTWLRLKSPDHVTVEKGVPGAELPRPVDGYVEPEPGKKFAYWILETGLRSREPLLAVFSRFHLLIHWVFLSNMLRLDEKNSPPSILLTPTERAFASASDYNTMYTPYEDGESPPIYAPYTNIALNDVNIEEQTLITLRGLWGIHSPHQYAFKKMLVEKLAHMMIAPRTGEFVYPGEYQKLQAYREARRQAQEAERKRQKQATQERQQPFQHLQGLISQQEKTLTISSFHEDDRPSQDVSYAEETDRSSSGVEYLYAAYPCKVCGKETTEWVE